MEEPVKNEPNPAKKMRGINTATKYLIKIIKRFPREEIDDANNIKLYKIYDQLLEAICNQVKAID
jgi:hypothetical protein